MAQLPAPPAAGAAVSDWRRDELFRWPERIPWSRLAPQFHERFGRADPADPQPEHLEVIGQNGSGKTHAAGKLYQERAFVTGRPSILAANKPLDRTLAKIGWPIAGTWGEVTRYARDGQVNVIYHPRTQLMGAARKRYYDDAFTEMLDSLWASATPRNPGNTDVIIDDWGFSEKLPQTHERLEQYLREGRAPGFSVGALKQRPQGGTRLTSSETQWTLGFRPKDDADLERWAQLFGARRDWMPVFRTVDRSKREFVIKDSVTGIAFISWIDEPLQPVTPPRRRRTLGSFLGLG